MLGFHDKAVLQFSGGKDSTSLLYMARPWLDRITVVFVDTGVTFPHVLQFVKDTCSSLGTNLRILNPEVPIRAYHDAVGYPSDIVPVDASHEMAPYIAQDGKVQSYLRCCAAMLFQPMQKFIAESGATLVLRGSKASDTRKGVGRHYTEGSVTYDSPLWDWSDERVMAYLAQEGVTLPEHYNRVADSLDCWLCTAHLAHHGKEKMRFVKSRYPKLWPDLRERLIEVQNVVDGERNKIASAFAEID